MHDLLTNVCTLQTMECEKKRKEKKEGSNVGIGL